MKERWQTIAPPPQPPPQPREPHFAWVLALSLLVSLVGAGLMHLLIGAVRGEPPPAVASERTRVVVPDLVGLAVAGARLRVEADGLLLHLVGPAPEGDTDRARVAWQRPLAGSLVRADDAVEVGFEVPPEPEPSADPVDVAPVVRAAEEARTEAAPGSSADSVTDEAEHGVGDVAPPGEAQEPVTEAAPELVIVPSLGRMSEDDARARLAAAGLRGRFDTRFSPSVPSGRVILSRPGAGERVEKSATVMVYVAE